MTFQKNIWFLLCLSGIEWCDGVITYCMSPCNKNNLCTVANDNYPGFFEALRSRSYDVCEWSWEEVVRMKFQSSKLGQKKKIIFLKASWILNCLHRNRLNPFIQMISISVEYFHCGYYLFNSSQWLRVRKKKNSIIP